jgi:hypothetical protein
MKPSRTQDQEESLRYNEKYNNAYPGGNNGDKSEDKQLFAHAREKLKGRLYETGMHHQNMPFSMQKPTFQPSTIVPRRVIQGYKFYQTRQEENQQFPKARVGTGGNLNNVGNLVNQSMTMNVNKSIRLPRLGGRVDEERKSRSLMKTPATNFQILPKSLLEDSPEGDRIAKKINQSFGGVSPINNKGKLGKTFDAGQGFGGEFDTSFNKVDLNMTYDEGISRKIIGKLTGKVLNEPRPYTNTRFYRSNSVKSRGLSQATEDDQNMTIGAPEVVGKVNQLQDIDSFIYLIKEGKINPQEFIYLVRKDGDHYNLKVTDYCNIKDRIYWTLSAKGVTKFDNNFPVEFITLKDWLRERD